MLATTWTLTSAPQPAFTQPGTRRGGYQADPSAIMWTDYRTQIKPADETARTSDSYLSAWLDRERELARIRNFKRNWDGLEADPPSQTLTDHAELFLRILKEELPANPPMRILLSADSSIAFEWAMGGSFVQAEIRPTNEIEWMFATPGKEPVFRNEVLDSSSNSISEQGQVWQQVPAAVEDRAYASAR
jgi:hypothetical protein